MKTVHKALLGRKVGMTQLFAEDGRAVPVTVISAGPCTVIQRKSADRDGYDALQLGYDELPDGKRLNRPRLGHFQRAAEKAGKKVPPCRHLVEFRFADCDAHQVGDQIRADVFEVGEVDDIWLERIIQDKRAVVVDPDPEPKPKPKRTYKRKAKPKIEIVEE